MTNQALREAAHEEIMCREVCDTSDKWQDEATPEAVLALLDENSRLMTERDALREGMEGSSTRLAADIYFQLIEECEIPPGGSLVEHIDNMKERIAELENDEVRQRLANAEHQLYMAELAKHNLRAGRKSQFRKRKVAEKRIAELEASPVTVKLPDLASIHNNWSGEYMLKADVVETLVAAGIALDTGE